MTTVARDTTQGEVAEATRPAQGCRIAKLSGSINSQAPLEGARIWVFPEDRLKGTMRRGRRLSAMQTVIDRLEPQRRYSRLASTAGSMASINVESLVSAFELLTRFETGRRLR